MDAIEWLCGRRERERALPGEWGQMKMSDGLLNVYEMSRRHISIKNNAPGNGDANGDIAVRL